MNIIKELGCLREWVFLCIPEWERKQREREEIEEGVGGPSGTHVVKK